ncbi:class A beta-lactamase [Nocardioides speluncae]|uniref:class A beta-lactamase n=1 Tax=Nocardioides speluncae TaxID=2670337 RepID=UPI000D68B132|nr:class A beta-lactamase [Nocardioides speluncae]
MDSRLPSPQTSRRTVLTAGAVLAAGAVVGPAAARTAPITTPSASPGNDAIAEIEQRHDRRIGLYAVNLRTGRELAHRPDERFAMCSTFKTLAVAAVLAGRLVTPDPHVLGRRAYYPPSMVTGVGYAARMQVWQEQGYAPTVAEVCEAAQSDSDNAAANWLLQQLGGPDAITRLARELGDSVTTLTRWEPELNAWEPGQQIDTTTPRAMGGSYVELLLGRTLDGPDRRRLTRWMLASRTGGAALRAGLPAGWRIAEKTGSGAYGTRNDVGIAWTDGDVPILISCLTRSTEPGAPTVDAPLADVARHCAEVLA